MFDFFSGKKTKQPITVTLEDLSTLWTRYNRVFEPVTALAQVNEEKETAAGTTDRIIPVPLSDDQDNQSKDQASSETAPISIPAPIQDQPPAPSTPTYNAFVQDIVQPYRDYCIAQNALDPILHILNLLETEGSCPSIGKTGIIRSSDTDMDYVTIQDALSGVTLRDHSHHVARRAVKLLKDAYADYQSLIPKMLVCSLAHDIGKIPSFRENTDKYVKADHPIIGGAKLREMLSSFDEAVRVSWIDSACKAVESHHRKNQDSFLNILQEADSQARKAEVESYRKDFVFQEWNEWFSPQALLEALKKRINVIAPNNKNQWQAFSFNGVVYAKPNILIQEAIEQAKAKKVFDMRLLRSHRDKETALYPIVNSLKEIHAIFGEDDSDPNYFGEEYEIKNGQYKDKQFLVPLKLDSFGMASEIEKDKSGFFYNIEWVKPMRRTKK